MSKTWAILPVKAFDRSKTRLSSVLSAAQCKKIARVMATDVLRALSTTSEIDRILIVGQGAEQQDIARRFGCEYENDEPTLDVSANLTRVALLPRIQEAARFILVPADMPQLQSQDFARVLNDHIEGLTICRATRDEGTNAYIATMPQPVEFSFGAGSARRHTFAAEAAGEKVRVLDDLAFARDIDTPDDLRWLSRQDSACDTARFLHDLEAHNDNLRRSA